MNSLADLPARLRALPAVAPLIDVLGAAADVHVVGGAVRDLLLGGAPLDVDLVVEGDAAAAAGRLAAALGGAVTEHDRFGTATVLAGGHAYDLARARTETYARPGALPDVAFGSLADDLRRRDFTINAIAVGLDGTVSATPNAFDDLAARRLRVLHDASFRDDPTRLLRLVRYATRLRFAVEEGTAALAAQALAGGALATVTPARIGGELRLLLRERAAAAALAWLASWGDALVPGFAFDAALAERARALLPAEGREDLLLLAVAVLGLEEAALRAWLDALGFPGRERDAVVAAATGARDAAARLSAARRPSEIAAAL
ncbi:MAG: Polynucleotide adenylyltransferase region, partial [Conexibacter sp.]|nr:Polynucleotide adenylyltransferase region [Conexibacter sp.]